MKMNGMKIIYYWVVNFIFDIIIYVLTIFLFFMFGYYVMQLKSFTHTSAALQILVFIGWGIAQIIMAFLFYPFIHRAYTASLVGYIISLWFTIISVTLNISLF